MTLGWRRSLWAGLGYLLAVVHTLMRSEMFITTLMSCSYEQYRDPELVAKAPEETDRVLVSAGSSPPVGSSQHRSRGSRRGPRYLDAALRSIGEASRELVAYPLRPTLLMSASARASPELPRLEAPSPEHGLDKRSA